VAQHVGTADTGPFVAAGAEHRAQVTKTRGTQQGIAQRVGRNVAVGMTGAAVGVVE
jgi:hypothetical protein